MTHKPPRQGLPVSAMISGFVLIACLGLGIGLAAHYDLLTELRGVVNEATPTPLFLVLMFVVPMTGLPLSIFLVTGAIKFGFWGCLLLTGAMIPLHLALSHLLATRFLRGPITALAARHGRDLTLTAYGDRMTFTLAVLLFPAFSYAVKNYLLALGGVHPVRYFLYSWPVHMLYSLPFVLVGAAVVTARPEYLAGGVMGGVFLVLVAYLASIKLLNKSKT